MEENNKPRTNIEKANAQKQEKTPVQPNQPVGSISSSNDEARLPDHVNDTPPDQQTKGNP